MKDTDNRIVEHEGKFLRVVKRANWEYVERPNISGVVVILAITDEGNILLTEQFRIPVNATVIELPAGLAGDHPGQAQESLIDAAHRELYEETGYTAGRMEILTEGPPSAGLSNEVITLVRASALKRAGSAQGDGTEQIILREIPLHGIASWLEDQRTHHGKMVDPKVYSGLYFALARQ